MLLRDLFKPLKETLPQSITRPVRAVATAALTPLVFAWKSGHFRSSLFKKAMTADGGPLPWYNLLTIYWLVELDTKERSDLEFGAGQSSLWRAARSKTVVALEGNSNWAGHVRSLAPENVAVVEVENSDVTVIDGLDRSRAADPRALRLGAINVSTSTAMRRGLFSPITRRSTFDRSAFCFRLEVRQCRR